jgi:hypothetical protein
MFSMRLLAVIAVATTAFAAEITGTATNKTTNKPAAGDEVVLLRLQEGMQEVTRTKTDARGRFTLRFDDSNAPHLVRVSHVGVNYHRPAPPGTQSVEVEVFDAAEKVQGVRQTVDVMRIEADATNLRIVEMFAVQNDSTPPRTQMGPRNFEIQLPPGAQIRQSMAAGPGGMPITNAPIPTGESDRYTFAFPIRPGETRFQVAYSLPYNGAVTIEPRLLRSSEDFAVSVPTSMQLAPVAGSALERRGEDAGMAVYVANGVRPGQPLGFRVSGTGTVPGDSGMQAQIDSNAGRPGGGIGTPVNTPDPLYKYRWWIIATVAVALAAGAAYSMSRATQSKAPIAAADREVVIQEAIKNELFDLESDRLQHRISAEEYSQAKVGLERLLSRTMSKRARA